MPIQNVQRAPIPPGGGDSVATGAVTVTASGTINTKGSWTQVFAATTYDTWMIVVQPDDVQVSATNSATLLDVGIGAAGVEQVLIPNIYMGAWNHGSIFQAPMFIPAGTRVAIRCQSVIASKAFPVKVNLVPAPVLADACQWCETWGADTANSKGLTFATPGVAGTKTGWTQITAATTRVAHALTWSFGSDKSNTAASKGGFDIGYGASGSEQALIQDVRWEQLGSEQLNASHFWVPVNLPAGVRLAVRFDSTSTSAGAVPSICVHLMS